MNKKILFVKASDSLKETIRIMKKNAISQIPVKDNSNIIGLISEKSILDHMLDNSFDINIQIEKIIDDAPSIISLNTGITIIIDLLKYSPIILVAKKGKIQGIISKSDLLNTI